MRLGYFEWWEEYKNSGTLKTIFWFLVLFNLGLWFSIFSSRVQQNSELYFLDIGQGDSSLVLLPGNVKVLIDGGPPNGLLEKNLQAILPLPDRYIDLVAITHPQQDHYGGFIELFKHYTIGAILTNGQSSKNVSWEELEKVITEKQIPEISLHAGDAIIYGGSQFDILSPAIGAITKDINDLGVVMRFQNNALRALFTADISAEKERELAKKFNLGAEILKVSHHGSKFSSDPDFLKAVGPRVSVIGVGKKNTYGHPTAQALNRLAAVTTQLYRTDQDGIIKIIAEGNQLRIFQRAL